MDNKPMTDEELVQTYQETEDNFFLEQLIKRYNPLITAIVGLYHVPKQDYEDSKQEILLQFIKLVKKYKTDGLTFEGYVKNKLKNKYRKYIRRNY
jgi:DNA-directed RNA polymerase specialized sigma subunit